MLLVKISRFRGNKMDPHKHYYKNLDYTITMILFTDVYCLRE